MKQSLPVDRVITRILENALTDFESLRHEVASSNRKNVADVREIDMAAARLLRGVEYKVGYNDLAELVETMKSGIAARRVELTA